MHGPQINVLWVPDIICMTFNHNSSMLSGDRYSIVHYRHLTRLLKPAVQVSWVSHKESTGSTEYKAQYNTDISITVFFSTLPVWSHNSPTFSIHSIIHIGHSSSTISWLQSQDHKPLLPVRHTSLVEQASSYSSCSLSVQSFIITQLFSIIMLWY